MVPLSVAALAQDPCVSSATAFRDPHVSFAYGGTADFRGRHNTLYNFLSAPGLAVNVKTEEAMFTLHDGSLTVNGTFLTEAHVVARISPQKVAQASFYSAELDRNGFGWQIINGTCVGRPFKFGHKGHKDCFGLKIAMVYSSGTFQFGEWTISVRGMPSCEGCLIAGPKHRLDVSFTAHGDAPSRDNPHGIIGRG